MINWVGHIHRKPQEKEGGNVNPHFTRRKLKPHVVVICLRLQYMELFLELRSFDSWFSTVPGALHLAYLPLPTPPQLMRVVAKM